MSKRSPDYSGEAVFPGTITTVGGIESGDGEGLGVIKVSSATVVTSTATIISTLSNVSGAWVVLRSAPSSTTPSFPRVTYSNATIYLTMYNVSGGTPSSAGTLDVYAKGNF